MASPVVLADHPMWSGRWDYSHERRLVADAGAELVVPTDTLQNERLLASVADELLQRSDAIVACASSTAGSEPMLDAAAFSHLQRPHLRTQVEW